MGAPYIYDISHLRDNKRNMHIQSSTNVTVFLDICVLEY
jgi:hypothetical protein